MSETPAIPYLDKLMGLQLSIARKAAATRGFHFGAIRQHKNGKGTTGAYVLHIQCAWRIEDKSGVITGKSDLWEPADQTSLPSEFDWEIVGASMQDKKLERLLGGFDPITSSYITTHAGLVVETIRLSCSGDLSIDFTDGVALTLFPDNSINEDWRFFGCGADEKHLVCEGGKLSYHG